MSPPPSDVIRQVLATALSDPEVAFGRLVLRRPPKAQRCRACGYTVFPTDPAISRERQFTCSHRFHGLDASGKPAPPSHSTPGTVRDGWAGVSYVVQPEFRPGEVFLPAWMLRGLR